MRHLGPDRISKPSSGRFGLTPFLRPVSQPGPQRVICALPHALLTRIVGHAKSICVEPLIRAPPGAITIATSGEVRQVDDLLQDRIRLEADWLTEVLMAWRDGT